MKKNNEIQEFKYAYLVRFVVESLDEFTNEQLDTIAIQASFTLEDRLRSTEAVLKGKSK
jgi:hypothetical protein